MTDFNQIFKKYLLTETTKKKSIRKPKTLNEKINALLEGKSKISKEELEK